MHVLFIPYGKRDCVELMLREMEAQKHWLTFTKGEQKKKNLMNSQIRVLPFGVYEYVFPREDLDIVLYTLRFDNYDDRYTIKRKFFGIDIEKAMLKFLACKPIPEFKKDKTFPWIIEGVGIIPVGIREDTDIVEQIEGEFKGWTHEAI
jgi:hypothetical protein